MYDKCTKMKRDTQLKAVLEKDCFQSGISPSFLGRSSYVMALAPLCQAYRAMLTSEQSQTPVCTGLHHLPSRGGSLANETSNFVPKSDAMGHFEKSNKNDGSFSQKISLLPLPRKPTLNSFQLAMILVYYDCDAFRNPPPPPSPLHSAAAAAAGGCSMYVRRRHIDPKLRISFGNCFGENQP